MNNDFPKKLPRDVFYILFISLKEMPVCANRSGLSSGLISGDVSKCRAFKKHIDYFL